MQQASTQSAVTEAVSVHCKQYIVCCIMMNAASEERSQLHSYEGVRFAASLQVISTCLCCLTLLFSLNMDLSA
jgi:hypothetical protein